MRALKAACIPIAVVVVCLPARRSFRLPGCRSRMLVSRYAKRIFRIIGWILGGAWQSAQKGLCIKCMHVCVVYVRASGVTSYISFVYVRFSIMHCVCAMDGE